ncbi:hypothetical protein AAZX31_18G194100 [Glycine max]|uniref:Uncharacterized protein n=1 Tax=Glycine max TaxID=3847 RepID=K7MTT7_SOYBN|nr:uncharacterized protein LOC100788775 [Glycine max]KAG4937005.1 hypothetical protein JHK85_051924 [Glycine max]KAG5092440.1 hypothetical protein JHK82_051218 [Glycine max]KAG5095513.1 hypothetical protein JHK84_051101 [Glycine max]KAH1155489.1 hypothetical protein GYH30_050680 [Glycine max]KAH1199491.1 hypothetical protein GmHk_18G052841 [Glycine max]|eukprot:XP_006602703.1 uncharacterized protein LOC100788775 [Glycine max]
MLTPTTGVPKRRPRSGRTPLQLKNTPADPIHPSAKPKPKPKPYFEISLIDKENNPVAAVAVLVAQPPETSLAEELSAVKKKLERMRADKEKTEKMLNEKHAILDAKMKEMEERGEIQKNLEIEVDRLFRLKELKYRCMRVSPMRTLREKEQGKIVNEAPSQSEVKTEETVASESESESESESVGGECQVLQSPGSACSQTHTPHTKSDS